MGATILQQLEQESIAKLAQNKKIDDFAPGDTVRVKVRIIEGESERLQAFEGVCIARKNRGLDSSFTLRKISHGEGVERIFPLYSPRLGSIELVRKGEVRRAKLYYLRDLTGKAARITEKMDYLTEEGAEPTAEQTAATEAKAAKKAARAEKAEKKSKAKADKKAAKKE